MIPLNQFDPTIHRLRIVPAGTSEGEIIVEKKCFFNNRFFRWIRHLFGNRTYDIASIATILSNKSSQTNEFIFTQLKKKVMQKNWEPLRSLLFLSRIFAISPGPQGLPTIPPLLKKNGDIRLTLSREDHNALESIAKFLSCSTEIHEMTIWDESKFYEITYDAGRLIIYPSISSAHPHDISVEWNVSFYSNSADVDMRPEKSEACSMHLDTLDEKARGDLQIVLDSFKKKRFYFPVENISVISPRTDV